MILARWMAGEKAPALAKELGLHRGRVAQIILSATMPRRLCALNDIDNLGLSTRLRNALYQTDITTHEQLLELSEREMRRIPNLGQVSWAEIRAIQEKLRERG
jgi:DNA-directed RNA polymerase alpha subunit